MNADLERLVLLQAQDLELKRLRAELAEAPRRVAAADTAQKKAAAALEAAKQSLSREEVLRRSQESDVRDRQAKVARLRRQLDAATSTAQVAALEHEIAFAERSIATLEDEELLSMERTEGQELAREAAREALGKASGTLDAERARAAEMATAHGAEVARIEAERRALRAEIAEDPLSIYDRVAKSRGTGVSEAADGQCSACRMKVRPQRWNNLTGREFEDTLFTCESCGRLLFWDPRRDAPVHWATGDRLRLAIASGGYA